MKVQEIVRAARLLAKVEAEPPEGLWSKIRAGLAMETHGIGQGNSKKIKDLTGQVFGRLTVVSFAFVKKKFAYWNCVCSCGAQRAVRGNCLSTGGTKSCGCIQRENPFQIKGGLVRMRINIFVPRVMPLCSCGCGGRVAQYEGKTSRALNRYPGVPVEFLRGHAGALAATHVPIPVTDPAELAKPTREIPLTKGYVAMVDAEDYSWLSQYSWSARISHNKDGSIKNVYAMRGIRKKEESENPIYQMHRLILGITDPAIEVDHVDFNGINNSRDNLRVATDSQQQGHTRLRKTNTTGFKGINYFEKLKKWGAHIGCRGKLKHLGLFADKIEAAKAYDKAAKELFGEFAVLNFPEGR